MTLQQVNILQMKESQMKKRLNSTINNNKNGIYKTLLESLKDLK